MANPLAIFRKYQKILLVVFGVALIIVFTVGGIVSQYMNRGVGQSTNEVVVKLKSETLRESDIQNLLFARHHLRNFLRTINMFAAERGATPRQQLGIPDTDAEADLVQTAVLSQQAQKMGMEISDQAIIDFLILQTQNKLKPSEFAGILQSVTQNRMSQERFFAAMRRELLAQRFVSVFQRGMLPPTPAAAWDYFLRLNRRIDFEAIPFPVEDFLARADEPTEAQIEALYEEGKNRYPLPDRAEPGFKRLKQIAIQYVKADLADFMPVAKASITDEQVKEYYEANQDEFRNISLPSFDSAFPSGVLPDVIDPAVDPAVDGPDESEEVSEEVEVEIPEIEVVAPDDTENDQTEPGSAAAADDVTDTPSADALPEESTSTSDRVPEGDSGADEGARESTELTPDEDDRTERSMPFDTAYVVAQSETGVDIVQADQPTDAPEEVEDAAESDDPVERGIVIDLESDVADGNESEDGSVVEPADVDAEESADSTADPLGDLPVAAGDNAGESRPEIKPLEEVSETIRTRLATPIARMKMDEALNAMRAEMRNFMGTFLAWDVSPDRDDTPRPEEPDLRPVAESLGLTVNSTPLVNVFQLQDTDPISGDPLYEISRAYDTNYVPFAQEAFKDDLRMFEVRSIRGQVLDTEFLYWKTNEVAESVPDLDEARDDVIRALKMRQALEFAKKDVEARAEDLNRSGESLTDAFANDLDRKIIPAKSVTWMASTNVPYLPPRLSRISGIQFAGEDFMRSVFTLEPGVVGTAVNSPQDTVYIVSVTGVETDEQQLRDQFIRDGVTQETAMLAQRNSQEHLRDWYASLEKDLDIQWQRDPLPDSRLR